MTLFTIFIKGGPLMFVLLAVSIAAVAIIINKYRSFLKVKRINQEIESRIGSCQNRQEVMQLAAEFADACPLSQVLNKQKEIANTEYNLLKDSLEVGANIAIHRMEKGLGWLSTISAVAPLIGFLGTVTGMVKVFMNIQLHSSEGIDITYLSGGIWEALLTTVGGLIIGIVAIIFYNDLVQQVEDNAKFIQEKLDFYLILIQQEK
jgi:biopolymer transport protein ExbB